MADGVPAPASGSLTPPSPGGPGEGWLRALALGVLVLMLALDAFVEDFDPNETLYVPLIGGAIVGNEVWAWAAKKKS